MANKELEGDFIYLANIKAGTGEDRIYVNVWPDNHISVSAYDSTKDSLGRSKTIYSAVIRTKEGKDILEDKDVSDGDPRRPSVEDIMKLDHPLGLVSREDRETTIERILVSFSQTPIKA